MTWQQRQAAEHVWFGVEWNESETPTSFSITPTVWRYDDQPTNNHYSTLGERLRPDPWGAGSWSGYEWPTGGGWRQVGGWANFNKRTYQKGSSAQTVRLTMFSEGSFGTKYNGSWISYPNVSLDFTITVPARSGQGSSAYTDNTSYGKLSYLTLTRSDGEFKAEWRIPGYMTAEGYGEFAIWSNIDFVNSGGQGRRVEVYYDPDDSPQKTLAYTAADSYWVRNIGHNTSLEKPYDRNRYYPNSSRKVSRVDVTVWAFGERGEGPKLTVSYPFKQPAPPEVEFGEWDTESNYRATYTIKSEDKDEHAERYDTRYCVFRQDNIPGSGYAKKKAVTSWLSTTETELSAAVAAPAAIRTLPDGQWCEFTVEAYNRGMWGDSKHVTATIVASRPARAKVTSVKATSLDMVTGVVNVGVTIPNDAHRWTTRSKLQRVKDVDPKLDAQRVAALTGWDDVTGMEQVDERYRNANWDTGFTDSVSAACPTGPNLRTWYRVTTENDLYYEDNAYQSIPVEASQLYREQTASDDSVFVEDLTVNADATAVTVLLGWPDDDSTGTEVSWSVHPDAWTSSEQPSTAHVTWSDPTSQGEHDNSASFTIYGTEAGRDLYVKARRYFEDEDGTIVDYGNYATADQAAFPFVPSVPPADVRLSAPAYIPKGQDVPFTWTFESDSQQTAWVLKVARASEAEYAPVVPEGTENPSEEGWYEYSDGGYSPSSDTAVDPSKDYYAVSETSDGSPTAIASGEDSLGACTVPYAKFGGAEEAEVFVSMTTGSEWADSEPATVRFADPPAVMAALPSVGGEGELPVILEQPVRLYCSSDTGDDVLRVRVVAEGITVNMPDRDVVQLEGDVVFDAFVNPAWGSADDGLSYTTVELPAGLDMHDSAIYRFEVTAVNSTTGLSAAAETVRARVRWAHQAHLPSPVELSVDESQRTVTVYPGPPDNAADTDVFDLYRVTPDGAFRIAEGVPFGNSCTDRYAPYGNATLSYRACTRTADGDVSWSDTAYELPCRDLRVDWGDGSYVELPYNVVRDDSWSKDFEERAHLDGSRSGFWNPGSSRTTSLSTDLVRFRSEAEQLAVRELARHAGPCFVRLPNGVAFEANVDVEGINESYETAALPVRLSATQVSLTDGFRVAVDDINYTGVDADQPAELTRQVVYWGPDEPVPGTPYQLLSTPTYALSGRLSTSYDRYTNEWTVEFTSHGSSATLGEFSQELLDYLAEAAGEDTLYLLSVEYGTGTPPEPEDEGGDQPIGG